MITTEQEAIDYIYASYLKAEPYLDYSAPDREKRHPEYTKELIQDLCMDGNNILITGSKGKGSVACMIAGILQTKQESVGLLTSPHVLTFRERIKCNGKLISEADFVRFCKAVEEKLCNTRLEKQEYISPIGIECAAAMMFFREQKTWFNVIECGKGVAYDDTRNVRHDYAVINPVFLEHVRELGPGLKEIAENKAAVMEQGQKCVYLGRQSEIPEKIFHDRAEEYHIPVKEYGNDFSCRNVRLDELGILFDVITNRRSYTDLRIPTWGEYQAENCALAISVCEDIIEECSLEKIKSFLQNLKIPGRMELYEKNPICILDACINRESTGAICSALEKIPYTKGIAILAIPEDKDYAGVAEAISKYAELVILTDTDSPHYQFSPAQLTKVRETVPASIYIENPEKALQYAKQQNPELICILGTTSLIAQMECCHATEQRSAAGQNNYSDCAEEAAAGVPDAAEVEAAEVPL